MKIRVYMKCFLPIFVLLFFITSCVESTTSTRPGYSGKTKSIKVYILGESHKDSNFEGKSVLSAEEITEESPNIKSVTRITDFQGEKHIWYPSVSSDGSFLVFSLFDKEKKYANLWKRNVKGGGITRLTYGKFLDLYPTVSRDGKYIYFSSNRSGTFNIWRIHISGGGGITRITSHRNRDFAPQISHDGSRIVFHSYTLEDDTPQIWTCLVDGSELTQIRIGYRPKWSKDDKKILFLAPSDEEDKKDIWLMDVDGTSITQLTMGKDVRECDWAPGGRIVYSALNKNAPKDNTDIWLQQTQLTTNPSFDNFPQFDEMGKLFFISTRGYSLDLWYTEPELSQ